MKTQRSERGSFATLDTESLMMAALAEADAWQRTISAEDYAGELSNRPERSRKSKGHGGRVVSQEEKLSFSPATFRVDPPISLARVQYRTVRGMAIAQCLACGEQIRKHPDSDRPCPRCRGHFFAWESRETDTYIGADYSLPCHWYGDLEGVSAHYSAIERLADTPRDTGGGVTHGRASGAHRLIPTGPDGMMRWLTYSKVKIGKPRGPRSKHVVAYFAPVDATLYADDSRGIVVNQRIDA